MMADAFVALADRDRAIDALEEAIARAPFMAERIKSDLSEDDEPGLVTEYLLSADPWEIQRRFRDRRQTL